MKWEVQESWHNGIIYDIVDAETKEIICITDSDLRIANLIASAPELLEQLTKLVNLVEQGYPLIFEPYYISDSKNLISKLKGYTNA